MIGAALAYETFQNLNSKNTVQMPRDDRDRVQYVSFWSFGGALVKIFGLRRLWLLVLSTVFSGD